MWVRWLIGVLLLALLGTTACRNRPRDVPAPPPGHEEPPGPALFEDISESSGIHFTYRNGEDTANHLSILESLGGGAALIDFDADGLLDVFLPGGGGFAGADKKEIIGQPCKLFRNLGKGKFQDVTASVGLGGPWFYSHAAAVGDYDRDGWPDLLVMGWGRVALFHNVASKQGRRFQDVTAEVGLGQGVEWATSAAFADLDGDGYPDLYVCQYVDWSWKNHPRCNYDGNTPDVCPPKQFNGLPHLLYHNTGKGKFTLVSQEAGLKPGGPNASKGLGVLVVDIDQDGKPDIYVSNDTVDNFLYMNRSRPGQLRFEEVGLISGAARDGSGGPNGSMGVDAGDPDRVGKPYLWVTNYENELHALYRWDCKPGVVIFNFHTQSAGIAAIGQVYVGWGTGFLDVDLDGWEDLFVSNGHAIRHPIGRGVTRKQKPVLLRNVRGRFRDISKQLGNYGQSQHLGRGVAFGDLDNDGRMDLVISNTNEPVGVLRGIGGPEHHWLGVQLIGRNHADYVGARVSVTTEDGTQTRFAKGGGSYASANDRRLLFGLGTQNRIKSLTVTWPDGARQTFTDVAVDRYHGIVQGEDKLKR